MNRAKVSFYKIVITMWKLSTACLLVLVLINLSKANADTKAIAQHQLSSAIEIIINSRKTMKDIVAYSKLQPDLFPQKKSKHKHLINREQRLIILHTWAAFVERLAVLDKLGEQFESIYKSTENEQKKTAFIISYAAFLARYHYAMAYIDLLENSSMMHTLLNEKIPELGIEKGLYKKIKLHFLHIARGAEFVRLNVLYQYYGKDEVVGLEQLVKLIDGMEQDISFIWEAGRGVGTKQTIRNAKQVIQDIGFTVWFPIQKEVSEWMGDVKVFRIKESLINAAQIQQIQATLQPGDIILERREWYLSNIGLPGYWPHAALYIGTVEQRKNYFDTENTRSNFLNSNMGFEQYLQQHFSAAYTTSIKQQNDGQVPKVIEAISEGVSFTTLDHSLSADSIVILRPRLSKQEKAIAIKRAFFYSGRPYDFNFDFLTDSELVCTELIYKAYEPDSQYNGIRFPIQNLLGRKVTTANDIAEMFDKHYGSEQQQLDFISFYDGRERKGIAVKSTLTAFRKSWERHKWYIWVQDTVLDLSKADSIK